MKTKKKNLWVVLAAATVIWAAFVWFYRDTLIMYIAPQAALGDAIRSACGELEEYYAESPLPILLNGYHPDGKQAVHMELRPADGAGVTGELQLQTDLKNNQILLEGSLPNQPKLGNISMYLDRDCAALTSSALLRGGYYGLNYETFPQDLRAIPLVPFLVSGKLIGQWEEEVSALQQKMDFHVNLPEIPKVDLEPLKMAPAALWAMRGRVCAEMIDADGETLPCFKVAYKIEGERARQLWGLASNMPFPSEGASLYLNCWLYQKDLVKLELNAQMGQKQFSCLLTRSVDGSAHSIDLTTSEKEYAVSTRGEGEWRSDVFQLDGRTYAYQWNRSTGDLVLTLPDRPTISMNLTKAEGGFRVESAQLDGLIPSDLFKGYICTAVVTKGTAIERPEFKNLSQWSLEDLLIFLNGVWTVIKPTP